MNKLSLIVLAGLMATQVAFAQDSEFKLPAPTTSGNVTYLSGGIGLDESTAMKQEAKNYPLELVFISKAGPREEYAAGVQVKITDRHGKAVLEIVSDGPMLLATLPDGTYRVEAAKDGAAKVQQAAVKKGAHKRLVFAWTE